MKTITFADLQAFAIDTDGLPAMVGPRGKVRQSDSKRGTAARRETLARRATRELKTRETVAA